MEKKDQGQDEEASCCPPTRTPALTHPEEYTAQGQDIKVDGHRIYSVGEAKKGGRAVVIIADVHGLDSGRHKAICDTMAAQGFYAVAPDIFTTDQFKPDPQKFLNKWAQHQLSRPAMDAVYKHLTAQGIAAARTGLLGFCFGSWLIYRESGHPQAARCFASGVSCHPSLVIEEKFVSPPGSMGAMGAAACHPMLMMPCQDDPEGVQEGGAVQAALAKKPFAAKCGFVSFKNMKHGFVSQGDVTDDEVRKSVEKAMDATTSFFEATLGAA